MCGILQIFDSQKAAMLAGTPLRGRGQASQAGGAASTEDIWPSRKKHPGQVARNGAAPAPYTLSLTPRGGADSEPAACNGGDLELQCYSCLENN
jgi:hypothetical protein